ncbi:hypothetical protein SESBI_44594 [Sesbania bispinosa]|nr:hypothetical protein SESBI_44594 [Sesbania bispinosa]
MVGTLDVVVQQWASCTPMVVKGVPISDTSMKTLNLNIFHGGYSRCGGTTMVFLYSDGGERSSDK